MKLSYTMKKLTLILAITFVSLASCTKAQTSPPLVVQETKPLTYLALGDSYTICESVDSLKQWPKQLVAKLKTSGLDINLSKMVAQTGWRTDNMLSAAKKEVKKQKYDLVSLLIGVNNEYQGWDPINFKPEFEKCLDYAIEHCSKGKKGVFVVSIPDYGYTPFGASKQTVISARLDLYNTICENVAKDKGVAFYNITDISRQDDPDHTLVAKDGLHPSAKQYGLWVDSFSDKVFKQCTGE